MSADQEQGGGAHHAAKVWLPPPLVFLAGAVLGVALHWLWPLSLPFEPWPGYVGGAVLAGAGVYLLAHAWVLFRRTGQQPAPWKPTPSMIMSGPYRFTRNPMYLGMVLILLALALALAEGWLLLFAAAALLVVHFTAVLPEELYLAGRFGEEYLRFQREVRRWL